MWIANTFVICATLALFLLWFRYMCSLMLAAQTAHDSRDSVAAANSLAFPEVKRKLAGGGPLELGEAVKALDRDFEVLAYLLRHMGASPLSDSPAETWMLKVDYQVQRVAFLLARPVIESAARNRISQMATIVSHFADLIGERGARYTRSR
jgi:hypothetical protein